MRDLSLATTRSDEPLPVMLWRARADMSCEYVSRSWLDFTGYSEEQALGDGWARGVHPEDLARWLDTCLNAFDLRRPFEIEYRLRRRDGAYRWVLDRGLPRFAADGAFLGFAGACLDIDERRHDQENLLRALQHERRLRAAMEQSVLKGVRVLIVDQDPAARDTISRVLGIAGAQTRGAASTQEAMHAFGSFHPDVLLADVAKPVEPVKLLATVARLAQPAGV